MAKTLVLGLGNPLRGDDGIGAAVISSLRDANLPSDVKIIDGGTPGLETALIWHGYQCAIIVDAADMDLNPGQWCRFLSTEANLPLDQMGMQGTLHNAGLAEAVALSEALDILPPELIIYGVQPAATGWEVGLSPEVQGVVTAVCDSILAEIGGCGRYSGPKIDLTLSPQ